MKKNGVRDNVFMWYLVRLSFATLRKNVADPDLTASELCTHIPKMPILILSYTGLLLLLFVCWRQVKAMERQAGQNCYIGFTAL